MRLGVNIDHVATLRQVRRAKEPDVLAAAIAAEKAGADGITVHLREDRRHIQKKDVEILRKKIRTRLNLEMSIAKDIVRIACLVKPEQATLVPEKRQEVTTEGGLDVAKGISAIQKVVKQLQAKKILVSLFIEPDKKQITAAKKTGTDYIELHTGAFANARTRKARQKQLNRLVQAAAFAKDLRLGVNAGHGLTYLNTKFLIERIPDIEELNIGHSIVSRAVFVGLGKAVAEMKAIINKKNRR